jgi:hypothetical protein
MVKTVTCGPGLLLRAAQNKGVSVAFAPRAGCPEGCCSVVHDDVVAHPTGRKDEVVVRGQTLAGDLFLSLLVAGAIG